MSSATVAAKAVKGLEREEFKVLTALASLLRNHESVTIDQIATKARMHIDKASYSMRRLNQMELVMRNARGYSLVMTGLDALALKILADKNIVVGLGRSIGVGKESDVFEAFAPTNSTIAIKFFRIGRISFRDVKRKRAFSKQLHHWLLVNIDAAKKEFNALKILHRAGVRVPMPCALAKHAIVMEKVEGPRLVNCSELKNPLHILESVLRNVKLALKAGLVSADLSEYNVLYDGDDIWMIDWPQNVSVKHPNAMALLKRDVYNVVKFFNRKYGVQYSVNDALSYVNS